MSIRGGMKAALVAASVSLLSLVAAAGPASADYLGYSPPSNPQCDNWVGGSKTVDGIPLGEYLGYRLSLATGNPTWVGVGACPSGAGNTSYGYGLDVTEGNNPYVGTIYSFSFSEDTPSGHWRYVAQFVPGGWCSSGPALVGTIYTNWTSPATYRCI